MTIKKQQKLLAISRMKKTDLYEHTRFLTDKLNVLNDAFNVDGWYNILTGMGTRAYDKRKNTFVGLADRFDRRELTELYRGDGFGARIVDVPADDMVRAWFKVEGDPEGLIVQKTQDLAAKKYIREALVWSRLFGGAIVLMLIDDGQDLEQPVNLEQIRNIEGLQVYDRWDVTWTTSDLYNDPKDPKFGTPEIYRVNNYSTAKIFEVHESRILKFEGELVPQFVRRENLGWGDSVINRVYERLRGLGDGYAGVEGLITEFIIGKLTIKNLQSLIGSKEGTKKVQERLQIIDMSKHMLNTILLDEKEEFDRVSATGTQGLSKLLDQLVDALAGVSGIPRIKLLGEQSKGLGSEAAGNIRFYYDDISADQEEKLQPELEKLSLYIQLSKDGEFKGIELDNWTIVFNPLWQPTAKEEAETRKAVAETDKVYFEMGLPGEIIIVSRYGGETYSTSTVIPEKVLELLQIDIEAIGTEPVELKEPKEPKEPKED
jgi:phage-related protein (TIGR01555 family)